MSISVMNAIAALKNAECAKKYVNIPHFEIDAYAFYKDGVLLKSNCSDLVAGMPFFYASKDGKVSLESYMICSLFVELRAR